MITLKMIPEKIKDCNELEVFFCKKFGESLYCSFTYSNKKEQARPLLHLNNLNVTAKKRRKGYGTKFMLDVCLYADYYGMRVELIPLPLDKEIDKTRLEKFYRRFGFKYIKKDYQEMFRNPKPIEKNA